MQTHPKTQINNAQSFSIAPQLYAAHRPNYPKALFAYLSSLCAEQNMAWDCATGNGQAALACAEHFAHVEATDISAEQIEHTFAHPRIHYTVSPAEHTPFANACFELITVAQAVHWFNLPAFFRECERVLQPKGILAVFGYADFEVSPEIDCILRQTFSLSIDPYWADGNRLLMSGYAGLQLPFQALQPPQPFCIEQSWTLTQLAAYLQTWSAVKIYSQKHGDDPVVKLVEQIRPLWGEAEQVRAVKMPLHLLLSRKEE
ncbi:MAG TPA: class I SAM-dependent methyltransferase [Anaerolineales bacterium]|nr:class I SAM-dependent methyltransferase [Anaerolineales bacterium]